MPRIHSSHLVDPELQSLLDAVPTVQVDADILPALRANVPQYAREAADPSETDVTVHHIDGPAGSQALEVWFYRPHGAGQALPCLLHIHGGGFVTVRAKARPDFRFKVRGSDLRCDLKINFQRARQGGSESVRGALGNFLRVPVPAKVARGEIIRLAGEGLPKARGGRGDLLVRILYRAEVRITRVGK